ncbi:dihydrolipoyl dehydrogenase [Syntrophotalea acetylenivorans]|uniref:Dihydrolipoyl dehydrogenase n=1 Tax=Syntrophotalea acetylenivorans TaxID=1842532 RepID=A0A1L3GNB2_9BACT|nr:dihydrolipoyl dehydrogenase [Syntrophotalea acetylenivorans]APG27436.1 dihydrolipoyl dehydrogenase [Syntrophotalea acetylenivorans]
MTEYDLAVIGGGPGGYTAAVRAAQQGMQVCLIEADRLGGTCLHRGCIPTKTWHSTARLLSQIDQAAAHGIKLGSLSFDFGAAAKRKDTVVDQLHGGLRQLMKSYDIEVFRGQARIEQPGRIAFRRPGLTGRLQARHIVLATGARPVRPAVWSVDGKNILTSDEILGIQGLPSSLLVIGGGYIGCELAAIFAAFGSRVTLVEQQPDLLGNSDREAVALLTKALHAQGVNIHVGTAIDQLTVVDGRVEAQLAGKGTSQVDKALVAVGRVPNSDGLGLEELGVELAAGAVVVDEGMRTSVENVFAIGDLTGGPQLAHVAAYQAGVAVANALGGNEQVDYNVVPSTVFTLPELSQVGLTEEACRARQLAVDIGRFSYRSSGKALADGHAEGFVKLLADKSDGRLLGATVVGEQASNLVAEIALALGHGLTAADVGRLIHAHPTLAEMVKEAAEDVNHLAIHRPPARRE